jgi:DNA-binding MarR family transcriptional regulator
MKTARQMERHFKGLANHWRISILLLVHKNQDISLDGIVGELKGNIKTISEHTRKLVQAGLLNKSYKGRIVTHSLSPYGQKVVEFIKLFK